MVPVGSDHLIVGSDGSFKADIGSLLSDGEVQKSTKLLLHVKLARFLFEATDQHHFA